ncbi:hypothetical protein J6TS2_39200 [Heyndrickxia sporothermodurans]|nr:hypothetical protein J6TS2_39200 [Heyndrickxia sporothermodurans]
MDKGWLNAISIVRDMLNKYLTKNTDNENECTEKTIVIYYHLFEEDNMVEDMCTPFNITLFGA